MRVSRLGLTLLAFSVGCGLIDKLRGIEFQLPNRAYSLSSNDQRWKAPPQGGVPEVSCGPGGVEMDCCMPPAPAPAIDCTRIPMSCDEGKCALKFNYEVATTVNLAKEVPVLADVGGSILSDILLKEIDLAVANSF